MLSLDKGENVFLVLLDLSAAFWYLTKKPNAWPSAPHFGSNFPLYEATLQSNARAGGMGSFKIDCYIIYTRPRLQKQLKTLQTALIARIHSSSGGWQGKRELHRFYIGQIRTVEVLDFVSNRCILCKMTVGSLSSDVFELRPSKRSGMFALLSRDFEQISVQIVF